MSKKVMSYGTVWVDANGKYHRDGDLPAVMLDDGNLYWYQHGLYHREGDKPAVVYSTGAQFWYKNGGLHRDGDKPAQVWPDGAQKWYDGAQAWHKGGKIHRDTLDENGAPLPATIVRGYKKWIRNGVFSNPGSEWVAMLSDGTKGYYVPEQNRLRFDNGEEHVLDEDGVTTKRIIPPSNDEVASSEELKCPICMENKKCIAFDCNHLCSCNACARDLDTCPMCRAKIKTKTRLFL
jgi:hypothetical protein